MRVVLAEVLSSVEIATTTARDERSRVRHVTLAPHAQGQVFVKRRIRRSSGSLAGAEPVAEASPLKTSWVQVEERHPARN
jgi:hypothetical protein